MKKKAGQFSELFRELEAEIGTRDLATLLFKALIVSIKAFKADSFSDFCSQFDKVVTEISSTEPKFGILIYHFHKLQSELNKKYCSKLSDSKWKKHILKHIEDIINASFEESDNLLKFADDELNLDGKTILIHDNSHTVQDVLVHNKKKRRRFKVIIAEQDFEKTHNNIERLHAAKIPFQVIPSYMLSHIHEEIDYVFFGALTLKDTMDFVMNPGTHGIISEFHVAKIPVYMFINTKKFSLWASKKRSGVFMYRHKRMHDDKQIEYERIKYSHDRVPAELFAKIITNEGVFDTSSLKRKFSERMKKFSGFKE